MDFQKLSVDMLNILRKQKLTNADIHLRFNLSKRAMLNTNLSEEQILRLATRDHITNLADHILFKHPSSIVEITPKNVREADMYGIDDPDLRVFECNLFVFKHDELKSIVEAVICMLSDEQIRAIKEKGATL